MAALLRMSVNHDSRLPVEKAKQFIPELRWRIPFRVAASAFTSRLVAPRASAIEAPTADATDALRTSKLKELS